MHTHITNYTPGTNDISLLPFGPPFSYVPSRVITVDSESRAYGTVIIGDFGSPSHFLSTEPFGGPF